MTLIIGAISNKVLCTVCDTRFVGNNGVLIDDNNIKNILVVTSDASLMVSFAGRADVPVPGLPDGSGDLSDWITNLASKLHPGVRVHEFVHTLKEELQKALSTPYPEEARALVVYVLGRLINGAPVAFKLLNFDEAGTAGNDFILESIDLGNDPKELLIDGWLPSTEGPEFQAKKSEAIKLLTNNADAHIIREKIIEMMQIGSTKSEGLVGPRAVGSILLPEGQISTNLVPDDGIRRLPSFRNKNIAVTGLTVTGNPPGEGDYIVGG